MQRCWGATSQGQGTASGGRAQAPLWPSAVCLLLSWLLTSEAAATPEGPLPSDRECLELSPLPVRATVAFRCYHATLAGFQEYLDAIERERPQIARQFQDELDGLQTRRTLAWILRIAGPALGITVAVGAFTFFKQTTHNDANYALLATGGFFTLVTLGLSFLIEPSKTELLNLVDHYNASYSEGLRLSP